jgi:membrane protease YdiL (CAAX protease family)
MTGSAIVASLFLFNTKAWDYEHYLVGILLGLLFVPMLVIYFILRSDADRFGFTLGDSRKAWPWVLFFFVAMIIAMVPLARRSDFQDYYPIYKQFEPMYRLRPMDVKTFLYFEFTYGMYMFAWEFFFRGYLLQGLSRTIGWWAVLVQAAAFGLMHYTKVPMEFYASFVGGIILGWLALRARSFLPCFTLHWLVSLAFDVLIVMVRHG